VTARPGNHGELSAVRCAFGTLGIPQLVCTEQAVLEHEHWSRQAGGFTGRAPHACDQRGYIRFRWVGHVFGTVGQALFNSPAVDCDPNGPRRRGLIYVAMERYDEALADLTRAIELNPSGDDYAAKRAEIHELLGKGEGALPESPGLGPHPEGQGHLAPNGDGLADRSLVPPREAASVRRTG
jgi:tetratricopeptide (TPR) repeat protein